MAIEANIAPALIITHDHDDVRGFFCADQPGERECGERNFERTKHLRVEHISLRNTGIGRWLHLVRRLIRDPVEEPERCRSHCLKSPQDRIFLKACVFLRVVKGVV